MRSSFNLGDEKESSTFARCYDLQTREADSGFAQKNRSESRTSDSSVRRETECERNSNVREYSRVT